MTLGNIGDPSFGVTLSLFGWMLFLTPSLIAFIEGALRGDDGDFIRWIMSKNLSQRITMAGCAVFGVFLVTTGLSMGVWLK